MSELVPIANTGVVVTARGATVPNDITFDNALIAIETAYQIRGAMSWAILDILMASEIIWGESYLQMINQTKMSYGTLLNHLTTWRHFPTPESRKWDLSMSHYAAVAKSYLSQEDKEYILDKAEREQMSREEVRDVVKGYGPDVVVKKAFSREELIVKVRSLMSWATANNAPSKMIEQLDEILKEFSKL